MTKRSTREEVLAKFHTIHGNDYLYDKFIYINSNTKGIISCKKHGDFLQDSRHHNMGRGCKECGHIKQSAGRKLSLKETLTQFYKIHGEVYSYDKFVYIDSSSNGIITCKIHGDFNQNAASHKSGRGCPKCGDERGGDLNKSLRSDVISQFKLIHGLLYSYDEFKYINSRTAGKIICKDHGIFSQAPTSHISGSGCPKCTSQTSKPEIAWLESLNLPNLLYQVRHLPKLNNSYWSYDGYDPETNTVYEFHGDYYHGNPQALNTNGEKLYPEYKVNPTSGKTYGELYAKTKLKERAIIDAGYNLVVMWESEWSGLHCKNKLIKLH